VKVERVYAGRRDVNSAAVLRVSGLLCVLLGVWLGPLAQTSRAGSSFGTTTTGNLSVAVVLVNFSDDRATPWTLDQARTLASTQLNSFYSEASGGLTTFTVTAFGWYSLSAPSTSCAFGSWKNETFSLAHTGGVDLTAYDHVILLFPRSSSCSFDGRGDQPGQVIWLNGSIADPAVLPHEMGHNFGLPHANAWVCPGTMIGSTCTSLEYGDPFDVMSYSNLFEFSSWHKEQLGWLDPSESYVVSGSGDYSLVSDESTRDSGVKLLLVPLVGGSYYAIETRTQTAYYDSYNDPIGPFATTGVLIRILRGPLLVDLIDGNPSTTTFEDAAFQAGNCLDDPTNQVAITTLGVTSGHATVHVDFGALTPTCVAVAPANVVPPTLYSSGDVNLPTTGDTLRLANDRWTGSASSFSYVWHRDGITTISGATSPTYTITSADIGHTISATVTATNTLGPAQASSGASGVVAVVPANTAAPVLSSSGSLSSPTIGDTLKVSDGAWSGSASTLTYSWQIDGFATISGATTSTYTIPSFYVGHTLSATVTATNTRGSASATSVSTATVVLPPAPPSSGGGSSGGGSSGGGSSGGGSSGGGSSGGGGSGGGGPADLQVIAQADLGQMAVGDKIAVPITIQDKNGAPAPNLHVEIVLSPNLGVASTYSDRGPGCSSTSATTFDCNMDYLSGDSVTGHLVITVQVNATGFATLTATASSQFADSAPADNTATISINKPAAPYLPPPAPAAVTSLCHVPRLTGLTLTAAQARLTNAGCRLGTVTTKSTAKANSGHVIEQQYASGKTRPLNATIGLTIGKITTKKH
jgi:hypothetical protein